MTGPGREAEPRPQVPSQLARDLRYANLAVEELTQLPKRRLSAAERRTFGMKSLELTQVVTRVVLAVRDFTLPWDFQEQPPEIQSPAGITKVVVFAVSPTRGEPRIRVERPIERIRKPGELETNEQVIAIIQGKPTQTS